MRTDDDAERLEALFRDRSAFVLAYALRRGATLEEAEDVVSETFIVAWRRLEEIPENPVPWLFGVAHKLLANEWRGRRRLTGLGEKLKAGGTDFATPFRDPVEALETRVRVRGAFAHLPKWDQEALSLLIWEGLSSAEAAEAMGCSRAHFNVKIWRARRRLVKEMAVSGH
jgi:RNA polymerase sigma-70 factor, ECF subfamily